MAETEYIYKGGKRYKLDNEAAVETTEDVSFAKLVGIKTLDAVDFCNEMRERYEGEWEDSQVCRFRLDGAVYLAVEDPSDGYRSHLGKFGKLNGEHPMLNAFVPCAVLARHRTKSNRDTDNNADILELIDTTTGLVVLEVGTDNSDDYYPSFVASFSPENMAANISPPLTDPLKE